MEEIALPVRGVEQRLDISSYLLNLSRWRARGCGCVWLDLWAIDSALWELGRFIYPVNASHWKNTLGG